MTGITTGEVGRASGSVDLGQAGPTALKTFFNIARDWQLTDEEARTILGCPRSTYYRWKRDPLRARLSIPFIERISYVLGIYKALQILFPDESFADAWVKRPNDAVLFGGRAPVEVMASGLTTDLARIRAYLDGARGIW